MSTAARTRPPIPARLLAASLYLGLAPLLGRRSTDPFVRHHRTQALALGVVFWAVALTLALGSVGWAWIIICRRDILEALPQGIDVWAALGVGLLWALPWLAGVVSALLGLTWPLPVVRRLTGPRGTRAGFAGHLAVYGLVALVVGLTWHARLLTDPAGDDAPVHVLYDDMDAAPREVFLLGAYPMARTAGAGKVAVRPLDRDNLAAALANARSIVLLCHGQDGLIVTNSLLVSPPAGGAAAWLDGMPEGLMARGVQATDGWEMLPRGPNLRYVYNTGCDCGMVADWWDRALQPAEVVTFDRLSAMLEHVWWLWWDAPAKIRPALAPPVGSGRTAS